MPGNHGDFVHEAEVLQVINALLGFGIGAHDGAAFEGVEHLGGMKAQDRQIAVAQDAAGFIAHTEGVGCVVDDSQVVVVCDFLNGIDIAGVAVAVHRHDGRGLRSDGPLRSCWDQG